MRKMFTAKFVIVLILILSVISIKAQESMYVTIGYNGEYLFNTDGISKIVSDYNSHQIENKNIVSQELNSTNFLRGLSIGMKSNIDRLSLGFDLHLPSFLSTAKFTDSTGYTEYYKRIKISHPGFSMYYGVNLINLESFKVGPSIAINLETYKFLHRDSNPWTRYAYEAPIDKFYMSASFRLPISIGGENFNFDIIPYYTLPFWKVNLTPFNEQLNVDYNTDYSTEEMRFNPTCAGVIMTFNFNLAE